jgi:hypothetical protein
MVFCIMYNNLLERYFDAVFVKLFVYCLGALNIWCLAMQPVSAFDTAPKNCEFMPNINGSSTGKAAVCWVRINMANLSVRASD